MLEPNFEEADGLGISRSLNSLRKRKHVTKNYQILLQSSQKLSYLKFNQSDLPDWLKNDAILMKIYKLEN